MITGRQIRMARAAVRWSAKDLAEATGLSWDTVQRMETADGVPAALGRNIEAVQRALEAAGVAFIDPNGGGPGVRLRKPEGE